MKSRSSVFSLLICVLASGPAEMGWRTNARNQNLNRKFTKLDTAGVRALINVFKQWPTS